MKYKILLILLIITIIFSLSACSSSITKDDIYINGEIEEVIEVNSTYSDKSVTCPTNYTLIIDGEVNTSRLGRQKIKYSVFSPDGALKKELYRFVTVVDTESPTYILAKNNKYYVGIPYTFADFITEYSDNYDNKFNLSISSSNLTFTTQGEHNIEIKISDTSKNTTTYTTTINAVLDIEKLILETYKYQQYKITSGTTGIGSKFISVDIDDNCRFSYYNSGSLHYLEAVKTNLGSYASIQISANYGEFNNADISFHISGNGNAYSVGFATFDARKKTVVITSFRSTINNLNLDTSAMLIELNKNINTVLSNFQQYLNNTLHLSLQ